MELWEIFIQKIVNGMGFSDYRLEIDTAHRHGNIFIYDDPRITKESLPSLVESINHLAQLIAQKNSTDALFFDINNYRKEREHLIVELAKAAARKVVATKQSISLPAMNSYERRLVHVELAAHPEITTESAGLGKERYVIVAPIGDSIKPISK